LGIMWQNELKTDKLKKQGNANFLYMISVFSTNTLLNW
jgi:hypothetical protein